jgi:hypothetical protein
MNKDLRRKELRVVIDAESALAYEIMVQRIKEVVPTIKVHPSQFVSFLVSDYYLAHFEKDKDILIAEFFDSDSFYQAQRKQAKGQSNFEELMVCALEQAQKYKSKKRRKAKSVSADISTQDSSGT